MSIINENDDEFISDNKTEIPNYAIISNKESKKK